ncbi:MAG: PAS domain S-box protein, partial [Desulfuromonadales bacterium]
MSGDEGANAMGLETQGVQARSLKEIFPESLAARLVAENEAVLVDGLPLVYEEMLPEDSGRYWLTCKFPIPREGKPSLIGGISLEITQQRQDQEALRESQERFRAFFESAAAGMAIIGLDGKPREVNPAFCQFLGYEREALLNSGFLRFTHPEEVEDSRRVYEDIRAGRRQSVDHERRFVRGDGAVVWGHVRGTWMRDS